MSRYENVLVDGPASVADLGRILSDITGTEEPDVDGEVLVFCWADGLFVDLVDHADLDDDFGMPLSTFRFIVSVRSHHGVEAQVAAAKDLYRILAQRTGYRLLLALNDGQEFAAARPALAVA